jgi:enoyl-CoA hydratase/carnithine racemase
MAAPDCQTIIVEKTGQVDWVTLNRPESLNAINTSMATELRDYFGNLYEDSGTRIVVLRGAGLDFSARLDIAMALENRNQILCSRTNDAREGMQAFLEKRAPVYTGS